MEALVSGCQVIATDVGGTREILQKSQFMLVRMQDVSELAYALKETLVSLWLNN